MAKKKTSSVNPSLDNPMTASAPTAAAKTRRKTTRSQSTEAATPAVANELAPTPITTDGVPLSVTVPMVSEADAPSYDDIARAAYHRYLDRGGNHGADFDDWVEAERQLRERQ